MKAKILIYMMLVVLFGTAHAAKPDGAPSPIESCDGLKFATGPKGKGYSKLLSDIIKTSKGEISLCEVNTEGGLDNLTTLSIKKADVGIVPIDALKKMAEGDGNIAGLLVVSALNSNYLHIVVSANGFTVEGPKKLGFLKGDVKSMRVTKMSELRAAPVALVGSAQLLVRQIDKILGYNMQFVDVDTDDAAFKKVQSGQVYAAFSVAGWPHGKVSKLSATDGITLAAFDVPVSGPYTVRPLSYKNVGVYNVQTLGVQNVLVTRPFSSSKQGDVATLKRVLDHSLEELKDGDYEPGWNEIKSLDASVDWPKFQYASVQAPKPKKK